MPCRSCPLDIFQDLPPARNTSHSIQPGTWGSLPLSSLPSPHVPQPHFSRVLPPALLEHKVASVVYSANPWLHFANPHLMIASRNLMPWCLWIVPEAREPHTVSFVPANVCHCLSKSWVCWARFLPQHCD